MVHAALAVAIFGSADFAKNLNDGLEPTEHSVGAEIFLSSDAADPVQKFIRKTEFARLSKNAGIVTMGWDEQITTATPVRKGEASATGTLAKRLGIVRHELVEIAGDTWSYGYDAAGELVGARLVYE